MKHSIGFWLYFAVAIVFATYFTTRVAMNLTGISQTSYVRSISITADTDNKDLTGIASAAAIAPGTDIYSISLDEINSKVAKVPGVKKSATIRRPNGNISIKVKLYKAVAIWSDDVMYFPLSADGTIVNKPTDTRKANQVLFKGPLPDDISEITKMSQNLIDELDYLEWIENRRWNLHTKSGITVLLPETGINAAIGNLVILNKNHKLLHKDIELIDMRDSSRILVK